MGIGQAHVEYVGFTTRGPARLYTLLVRRLEVEPRYVTLAIPIEAFLTRRVRYQDAAEICFLKLQRELASRPGEPPAHFDVSDAELEAYRVSHTPAPARRHKPLLGSESQPGPQGGPK